MPDERYKAVLRTQKLLERILFNGYIRLYDGDLEKIYNDIWFDARACLKHFPTEFYMEEAREIAPELFGDWKAEEKLTRIEIIGEEGREVVKYAPEGYYYRKSVQDDGQTIKFFAEKKYCKEEL